MYFSFSQFYPFWSGFLSNVAQSSYLMWYSSNLSDLLSFHTLYNITGVLMILLCCHWCPDGSTRVSLVEYSSSLRTCSPRYLIIQYLNNPKISPQKVFFFVFFLTAVTWGLALLDTRLFNTRIIKQKLLFSYSSSLRTCSPRYTIPIFLLILSRGSPDCIIM